MIWLAVQSTSRVFRVNTGRAWISAKGPDGVKKLANGSVLIESARPVAIGFSATDGSPVAGVGDLQGWTRVEVTPEMVGKTLAVYTSIEVKREDGGKVSGAQKKWVDQISIAGGIGIIASSTAEAVAAIQSFIDRIRR